MTWLWSADVFYHTLATTDVGWTMGPAGSTLAESAGHVWRGDPPERIQL